jgi:ADP-heptose:LPS heptosyltransferase
VKYGADILATGEAKIIHQENPEVKIAFGNPEVLSQNDQGKTKFYWAEIFENNPYILQPGENAEQVMVISNYPKSRPFFNYAKTRYTQADDGSKVPYKFAYNPDYEVTCGELYFSDSEIAEAEKLIENFEAPIIFIDPHADNPNKHWIFERWDDVIKQSSHQFVQLTYDEHAVPLNGAVQLNTTTFRQACAVLNAGVGRGILLTVDCDLHHAAAALKMPAIVLWSHYSHPDNFGYNDHINIRWDPAGKPCGLRDNCIQCKTSVEMIKVRDVNLAIEMALKKIS